ncbi:GNAT family N-acetyltransferase [Flavivirga jejuensis]|uniref:GNAT family N-acetyltransferase n=1 Tax=Flavivirga jejuensis TaxID=870487 RepID=A0ABT8WNQ4_9FLAO|nr:GNAT family N-acetyltransferase [Flavivirga jejuensis]MDO5974788.1 GNAT family N-acetyltransferase [Flavivirga jejuensis]
MQFSIETERLILRELRMSDLDGMFELDSDPEVHRYLGNKPVKIKEESQKIIESVISQYNQHNIGRWAAIEKSSGDFIGWSGLKLNTEDTMNGYSNFIDIGYRLIPRYWGKGYATESSFAALNYAFNSMKLKTVYGITEKENQASHNILLKVGLHYQEDFIYEKENLELRWYKIENK